MSQETSEEIKNEITLNSQIKNVWEKVKKIIVKYQKLIIVIILLLILINIQDPHSIVQAVEQGGGNPAALAAAAGMAGKGGAGQAMAGAVKGRGLKSAGISNFFGSMAKTQGKAGSKIKALGSFNLFTSSMGWMFSLVKTLFMFVCMIIALAILPGLPIFIFMIILFFILRTRMSFIKEL